MFCFHFSFYLMFSGLHGFAVLLNEGPCVFPSWFVLGAALASRPASVFRDSAPVTCLSHLQNPSRAELSFFVIVPYGD